MLADSAGDSMPALLINETLPPFRLDRSLLAYALLVSTFTPVLSKLF